MGESLVEPLLEKLLLGIALSKAEHAQLFNSVYEYCRKCIIESGQIGYELLMKLKRLLEKHVESLKNAALMLSGPDLLSFYEKSWQQYSAAIDIIKNRFKYCNQSNKFLHYAKLYLLAFTIWKDGLLTFCRINLTRSIQEEVAKLRRGECVTGIRLCPIINSFNTLDMVFESAMSIVDYQSIYKNYFECDFLAELSEYYSTMSKENITRLGISGYLIWAENEKNKEVRRSSVYLNTRSQNALIKILSKHMIEDHIEAIWTEFRNLLKDEKVGDLKKMVR
ncbi:unnamed protein product, partial [Hymenolepis diminuta]